MMTSKRGKRASLTTEFRRRLTAMRTDLTRTLATTDEELAAVEVQQPGEVAEGAAVAVVGDLLSRLDGRERHELDEIDEAQRRLESGVFGVCEGCHRPIPLERLRAVPTARLCASCQAREEVGR
jgi:DnaK suppressor protein